MCGCAQMMIVHCRLLFRNPACWMCAMLCISRAPAQPRYLRDRFRVYFNAMHMLCSFTSRCQIIKSMSCSCTGWLPSRKLGACIQYKALCILPENVNRFATLKGSGCWSNTVCPFVSYLDSIGDLTPSVAYNALRLKMYDAAASKFCGLCRLH